MVTVSSPSDALRPDNSERVIEGGRFDTPLILPGIITAEPERYIAEKPYELTKFEFSILRKRMTSELLFTITAGATAGIVLNVAGKALASLLAKESPALDIWELWAIGCGILASITFRFLVIGSDKERLQLEKVIDGHFQNNKPRRVHLTSGSENESH